jgi:hypothetical protein
VLECAPPLRQHLPLADAAAAYARLPPHHASQADVWLAVANYLVSLRCAYLLGWVLPSLPRFPPTALRLHVTMDVLVGGRVAGFRVQGLQGFGFGV